MKNRNYGIDSLRLILIYMVCLLHVFGNGGLLPRIIEDTSSYKAYWLIEVFSYCAVDAFALISGYTATNKTKKLSRLVNLWFQVFFYSFVVSIFLLAIGVNYPVGIKDIISFAMPVTFNVFWYFTAYFILFLATPILNKYLFSIDTENAKRILIAIVFIFSFLGSVVDAFITDAGYSPIWLIVLYIIGVLAKKIELFNSRPIWILIIIWALCIFTTWGFRIFWGTNRLISYISPTILLTAIIMVTIFSRLPIKENILSKLSPLAFGIYLFQLSPIIWNYFIFDRFVFILTKPFFIGSIIIMLGGMIIFFSGLIVEFIRSKLFILLKIDLLSEKIAISINKIIDKAFILLK